MATEVAGYTVTVMPRALEELAETAEAVADDQRQLARKARRIQRQRDRGWSWSRILDGEEAPGPVDLLRRSRLRLAELTSRLTGLVAHGLSSEGESRRQIARRLGVTHQRVSAIVGGRRESSES